MAWISACRQFFGESQRDAAGAGADVGDAQRAGGRGLALSLPKRYPLYKLEHGFDHVLGLRARNQDRGRDDEIHAPEFLMAGDVLRWNAAGALGERSIVASLFVGCEFALGMRVEIGAVAVEGEHEKQFGVQTRGGNVIRGQARDGRGEGLL